jgi:tetratricopeptide (TPR) repeat protein
MSARLRRKEIKRDEFVATVRRSIDYVESHGRMIIALGVGVLLVIVAAGGFFVYLESRSARANIALDEAMEAYRGDAGESATGANRAEAAELFSEVTEGFRGTDAAAVATVFLARIAADRGDLARARELWERFLEGRPRDALAAEVRLNLIALERQEGRDEEVALQLETLLQQEDRVLPDDTVLYELALTLERLGRSDEAIAHYQRIVDEFPRSPYRAEAQSELSRLARDSVSAPLLGS